MKNKQLFFISLFLVFVINIYSQVGINTDNTDPDNSAMLDVKSTDKGFLPPRVAGVANITNPVEGLMVYDTWLKCMRYFDGTKWSACMGKSVECPDTVIDIDNNTYPVVKIGNQCWMAKNLEVKNYPNGDPIPVLTTIAQWNALASNNTDDACGSYENNATYEALYGLLYSYAAAIADDWARDNEPNQGICPDGWHIPSDDEYKTLEMELGMTLADVNAFGAFLIRPTNQGSKLAGGTWPASTLANDSEFGTSGFNLLPGGAAWEAAGGFVGVGGTAYLHTSTAASGTSSFTRSIKYDNTGIRRDPDAKKNGGSVRCVKNN